MRRLPHIASFLLFIALCASAAYWAMQLFKPPLRPVAAPPRTVQAEVRPEAAAMLFGSAKGGTAVASNYQLRGVIFSGNPRDSVAIISADGKPAQAIRANSELAPGVTIKEVHRDYVLVSEGGATKRVDLPESVKAQNGSIATAPAPSRPLTPPPGSGIATRAQAAAAAQPTVPAVPPQPPVAPIQPPPAAMPAPVPPQQTPVQPIPGQVPPPVTTTAPPTVVVSPQQGAQPGAVPIVPGTTGAPPVTGVPQQAPLQQGTQQPLPGGMPQMPPGR